MHSIYVLYGSQNKLRLLPSTALADWFGSQEGVLFTAWCELNLSTQYRLYLVLYIFFTNIWSLKYGKYQSFTISFVSDL
jgi:hypothetical protein